MATRIQVQIRRLEHNGAASGNFGIQFDTLIIREIISVNASVRNVNTGSQTPRVGHLRWCSAHADGRNYIEVAKVRDDGRIMGVCHLAIGQENLEAQSWPFRFGNGPSVLQFVQSVRMNALVT